jgi:hypothetical protein
LAPGAASFLQATSDEAETVMTKMQVGSLANINTSC